MALVRKRRGSRTEKRMTRRLLVALAVVAVVFVLGLAGKALLLGKTPPLQVATVSTDAKPVINVDEPTDHTSQVKGKWYGLSAKNSIRSVEDFRRIVQSDPVLAKHYAGFDWSKAREERLQKPHAAYLAYRKNDVIRYTSRLITLPAGDRYITDGKRKVRFFCGNDFVEAPPVIQEQVDSSLKPVESDVFPIKPFETIVDPLRRPSRTVSNASPTEMVADSPRQDSAGAPRAGFPTLMALPAPQPVFGNHTTPHPPTTVPEPGTISLLGSGLAGMGLLVWISRRRGRSK